MPVLKVRREIHYFNAFEENAALQFGEKLSSLISNACENGRSIVVLCIGTDRSTGDSLGPLVGHMIVQKSSGTIPVFGTLNDPIHALNLTEALDDISSFTENPFVIAVDASLGVHEHIGFITLNTGSLKPGLGVKKRLPAVGDVCITGIVNSSGSIGDVLLQSTRLSTVMHMANCISSGICMGLSSI
ncbi:MAG: spore protease YyaC [Eubacterium sp.]